MRLLLVCIALTVASCSSAPSGPRTYYWDQVKCYSSDDLFYDECVVHWSVTKGGVWRVKTSWRDHDYRYITGSCIVIPNGCQETR